MDKIFFYKLLTINLRGDILITEDKTQADANCTHWCLFSSNLNNYYSFTLLFYQIFYIDVLMI